MSAEEEQISMNVNYTWQLLSASNPTFRVYVTHSSFVVLKVLLLGLYTGILRFKKHSFVNPEDLPAGKQTVLNDPDVDRARRAHRNDIENILPQLIVGFLFVLTDPTPLVAINCFRVVTISRCLHTAVYVFFAVRQSIRSICFSITFFITIFMAIDCIVVFQMF